MDDSPRINSSVRSSKDSQELHSRNSIYRQSADFKDGGDYDTGTQPPPGVGNAMPSTFNRNRQIMKLWLDTGGLKGQNNPLLSHKPVTKKATTPGLVDHTSQRFK